MDKLSIAKLIDHTLLKPTATENDIIKLCEEAKQYGFASVCVNPVYVQLAKQQLAASPVLVCTVIGFPLGANTTLVKELEVQQAVADGADELDMVINIGALKSGDTNKVLTDIKAVVQKAQGQLVKVIIEATSLTDKEKILACELSKEAGAHFVKTSTGFGAGGATVPDVQLMRQTVGESLGVKASGGIRNLADFKAMLSAGATRIGTSAGVNIVGG